MTIGEDTEFGKWNGFKITNGIVGEGVLFERIRRITGYLVGTVDRFNNAKRAEERDRVKHMSANSQRVQQERNFENEKS